MNTDKSMFPLDTTLRMSMAQWAYQLDVDRATVCRWFKRAKIRVRHPDGPNLQQMVKAMTFTTSGDFDDSGAVSLCRRWGFQTEPEGQW